MLSNAEGNNTMNASFLAYAVAVAGLALPMVAAASNTDVVTCSNKTLRGVYEFAASGFNIVNGVALPKSIIETLVFDGAGNVVARQSGSASTANVRRRRAVPASTRWMPTARGRFLFGDGIMFDL